MPRLPTRPSDVVFGATANRRLPEPVSPTPPSITIQGTPETAVHEHVAADAVTRTSMAPPSAPTDAVSGDTVSSQPGWPGGGVGIGPPPMTAPACSMTKGWPAMVTTLDRASAAGFADTESATAPDPWPAAPAAMAIHGASLRAVQAQPAWAETVTSMRPPAAGTDCCDRSRLKAHAAAACPISTRKPLTTTAPRRSLTTGLPAAVYRIEPSPRPDESERASQSDSLRASQAHSRSVRTMIEPDPPGAPTAAGWAVAVTAQRALGAFTDVDEDVPQALTSAASVVTCRRCFQVPMTTLPDPA